MLVLHSLISSKENASGCSSIQNGHMRATSRKLSPDLASQHMTSHKQKTDSASRLVKREIKRGWAEQALSNQNEGAASTLDSKNNRNSSSLRKTTKTYLGGDNKKWCEMELLRCP